MTDKATDVLALRKMLFEIGLDVNKYPTDDAFVNQIVTVVEAWNARAISTPREVPAHETSAERQAKLLKADGLMCEAHPGLEFEHDADCAGPGMPWMLEGRDAILRLAERIASELIATPSLSVSQVMKNETI